MAMRDWPIRKKLTGILLVVSGVVLLLTATGLVAYQVVRIRHSTVTTLTTLGRVIASNSTASLAFASEPDATETLSALAAEPHIVLAALYDAQGHLFATYPATVSHETVPASPPMDGARYESGNLTTTAPVAQRSGARLGTLYLVSDTRALSAAIRGSSTIAVAVLAVSLLAAYLLGGLLQGAISQPVLALAETAQIVSDRRDYSVRAPVGSRDEIGQLTDTFNQMLGRIEEQEGALRTSREELERYAVELEERVMQRTQELEERNEVLRRNAADLTAANTELDAFAYSVSHDLRAPLRSIDGFSMVLLEDCGPQLDASGQDALRRVRAASQRMGALIDDLLKLARVTRAEIHLEPVDLSLIVSEVMADLQRATPGREADIIVAPGLMAQGDPRLIRVALENLLGNGWKYSGKQPRSRVEFGAETLDDGRRAFFVRDNGVGFDMAYQNKLFGAFQRLHSVHEFEGTGIGLATVRRIVTRHGGEVWADSAVGRGATFHFTL